MTTALEDALLEVDAPAGWLAMPDPATDRAVTWPYEVVGRIGFLGVDAVRAARSLTSALDQAAAQHRPRRRRWVLVGVPAVPVVQAWAQLDVVPRSAATAAAAADAWEAGARASGSGGDVAVWHREVERGAVTGAPAVVVHDLLTLPRGEAQTVQHRAVVTWFPEDAVVLTLAVSTPLLAALPDIEGAALDFAQRIRMVDSR